MHRQMDIGTGTDKCMDRHKQEQEQKTAGKNGMAGSHLNDDQVDG